MIDILQTSTGDVELSDDLIRTEATEQHKRDLLLASQGDFKEAPTVGVDCVSFLHVRKQCERDGMRVDAVDYATDGTLTISAEYDDSNS